MKRTIAGLLVPIFALFATSVLSACGDNNTLKHQVVKIVHELDPSARRLKGPGENGMDGPYATIFVVRSDEKETDQKGVSILRRLSSSKLCRYDAGQKCSSAEHTVRVVSKPDYIREYAGRSVVDDINIESLSAFRPTDLVIRFD